MYHEKTVLNEKGDKVKIMISFYISMNKPCYSVDLSICEKGKRKFHRLYFDDYKYRSLLMDDRIIYRYEKFKDYVSKDKILEAKNELWNILSPIKSQET